MKFLQYRFAITMPILILFMTVFQSCRQGQDDRIIGVKIYDHQGSLEELFSEWRDLGINTAFSSLALLSSDEYRLAARENGISMFVIFPVFFNPEALAESPDLYALTHQGAIAKEEWVEFVCPSSEEYRNLMVENARDIIRKYDPDGISIDFIRHFVFWEKVYPDRNPATLPVTCFDSTCLAHFQLETAVSIPDSLTSTAETAGWITENHHNEWTDWRCNLITGMVQEIAEAASEIKPGILINIHLIPWAQEDFNGAIKTVAGQDIPALSQYADFLSPMTYAHMVKREPPWIHSIVKDIYLQTENKIIPSIQVNKAYLDKELDLEEFEESLLEALKPPSGGVVFWSWERLNQEADKKEVLKDIIMN
ncbi:MAG: hypothetical protein KAR19_02145 [Bacteroidales bacterium]|nr:hypothetical protein [Bacteroidales bacterium]